MTFKIYYKIIGTDEEDSIILSGDTIDEIQNRVKEELGKRNALGLYSEKI